MMYLSVVGLFLSDVGLFYVSLLSDTRVFLKFEKYYLLLWVSYG